MFTDQPAGCIYHIAKADFLQRIRSYYFLLTLGVFVFIIYSFVPSLGAGYTMISLGNYRGFYNSAWIGSMVATCVPFFAVIGFYLVNNAVQRDFDTGVGQIIATTRVGRLEYLTGKLLSNFAVLLIILVVIAVMTIVMFISRGEDTHLEPGKLLLPLFILTVPAMFIISAFAVVFDALGSKRRGAANILYFFVWIFIVSVGIWSPLTDVFGVDTCVAEIRHSIASAHPDWDGDFGTGLLYTGSTTGLKVFTWDGMNWSVSLVLQRLFWMCVAFSFVVVAAFFFNRFDVRESRGQEKMNPSVNKYGESIPREISLPLHFRYSELPLPGVNFSFFSLVNAELKLMLKGRSRPWLILTAGMFIATMFVPLKFAYGYGLTILWFMQVLNLSQLGCREISNRCNEYVFSAASPLRRQLPATFATAFLVMLALALPLMIRVLLTGNPYAAYTMTMGALFITSFAVFSGIVTGGSKLFEVVFTIMTYCMLNSVPFVDITGAVPGSRELGITTFEAASAMIMVVLAFIGRKRQIMH